jgi:hypothetical protein
MRVLRCPIDPGAAGVVGPRKTITAFDTIAVKSEEKENQKNEPRQSASKSTGQES